MADLPPQFDGGFDEFDLDANPYISEEDREVIFEYLDTYMAGTNGFSAEDMYNMIYDYYFDEDDNLVFDWLSADGHYEGHRVASG